MLPYRDWHFVVLKREGVVEEADCTRPAGIRWDQLIVAGESKVGGLDVGDQGTDFGLVLEMFAPE